MAWIDLEGNLDGSSSLEAPLSIDNYLNIEQSIEDGNPIELYLFNRSDVEYWSYTSSNISITYSGRTYAPVLIKRGNIRLDINILKTQLEIEVAKDNVFARNFITRPLEGIIKLDIYRQHSNSYVTYWRGFVRKFSFMPNSIKIICSLKNASLNRTGLMRKYQRNCGVPLFSSGAGGCKISKLDSNFYIDGTINIINGTIIDATEFTTKPDGWFNGGIFKSDNGKCLQKIISHTSGQIEIANSVPSSFLTAGDTFRAWAGCDHLRTTCRNKFDNEINFAGQPYLPNKNPFSGDAVM